MIHRCSVPGLNAALKPAEFRFCSWACSCWWLTFSAEVPHWETKPCSPWSLTWQNCHYEERWREGRLWESPPCRSTVGSMRFRCDVAQLAVYSRRRGRIGALGHCYGGCKRLCSVAWGGKVCQVALGREAVLSIHVLPCPAVLGCALVTGARLWRDISRHDLAWDCASSVHVPKYLIRFQIICGSSGTPRGVIC